MLSALLAMCAVPYAQSQPLKTKKVIVLFAGTPEMDQAAAAPFFEQLRQLGWIEGQNVSYERLFARGSRDHIQELARGAAAKRPNLIFAPTAFAATRRELVGLLCLARILKGAPPAELPIERPAKFSFFINRRTANALGVIIPPDLLLRADWTID